jgi:hypothetical protein
VIEQGNIAKSQRERLAVNQRHAKGDFLGKRRESGRLVANEHLTRRYFRLQTLLHLKHTLDKLSA